MLDEFDLPTPLLQARERAPVEISAALDAPRWPALRLAGVFGRYLLTNLRLRCLRRLEPDDRARRLRQAFEELGGLWIKIGQLISLRTDILSEAVCRELSGLQYRAQGFAFSEVQAIVQASLGQPLAAVFSHFEEAPLAAASISQVHRAVLAGSGVTVAVKVLRPHAAQAFGRDLALIGRFIGLLEFFKITPHVHWRKALWELQQMVTEELDFRYEAANTRRMRKNLKAHGLYVPKVFVQHSGQHVLVSEFVSGVLMSDFIRIGQHDPERLSAWCSANRVSPRKLGRRLFESAMTQMFEDNLFHADLHPGNILLLRGSRVALIDFGTIGSSDRSFLITYKASLAALAEKDYLRAADLTLRLAIEPPPASQLESLRAEMVRGYKHWEGRTHLQGLGYHDRSLAAAGADSGRIMFEHQVQLSWQNLRISRTWGTLDASLSFLLPEANYMKLFTGYFKKAQARRLTPRRLLAGLVGGLTRTTASVEEYREMLGPVVRKQVLLAPRIANVPQRVIQLMQTVFRIAFVFLMVSLAFGSLLLIHRFHLDLLWFHSPLLSELADEALEPKEIWIFSLIFLTGIAFTLRRAVKKLEAGA
jgi:ubiquinone biosynthesis protein